MAGQRAALGDVWRHFGLGRRIAVGNDVEAHEVQLFEGIALALGIHPLGCLPSARASAKMPKVPWTRPD